MTKAIQLDRDQRLHLGGYLVYLMVDFRHRIGGGLLSEIVSAGDVLNNELGEIPHTKNSSQLSERVQGADRALTEVNRLFERLGSTRQRDFLMPLYQNCSAFLHAADGDLRKFLVLLCDDKTHHWLLITALCHSMRNGVSELAGFLYSLDSQLALGERDSALKLASSLERNVPTYRSAARYLRMEDLINMFATAYLDLCSGYLGSEYHHKAANLVTDILEARIAGCSRDDPNRALFTDGFGRIQGSLLGRDKPRITPMLDFLRSMEPPDKMDEILLSDPYVIWLKQQVESV